MGIMNYSLHSSTIPSLFHPRTKMWGIKFSPIIFFGSYVKPDGAAVHFSLEKPKSLLAHFQLSLLMVRALGYSKGTAKHSHLDTSAPRGRLTLTLVTGRLDSSLLGLIATSVWSAVIIHTKYRRQICCTRISAHGPSQPQLARLLFTFSCHKAAQVSTIELEIPFVAEKPL